jgi:hypothetical protein
VTDTPRKPHMQRWGVLYLLAAMFLASWVGQGIAQGPKIAEEGWSEFWSATFENWQSEFLQLFFQALVVVGYAHIFFAKSTEDSEKTHSMLSEILTHLKKES